MPVSKSRKKKPSQSAATARRSGNPATRRAGQEAAPWGELANFGEYRRRLDRQRMDLAARDAEPILAGLVAADGSASWTEDELCRRLGRTLSEQDAASEARRESGAAEILDTYSPDQLLDAVTDATVQAAFQAVTAADEPQSRNGAWRLLLALARITPHPAAQVAVKTVTDLRERNPSLPEGPIADAPTGTALWCRDAYGTRFAVTAPFAAANGPDRWYLWDIDACGGDALTVGAGYFPDADQALASWLAAVGPDATSGCRLEPVSDPHLAARLLPGLAGFFHPGGESEGQYAEFHRCRRLAQELRRSDFLDGNTATAGTPAPAQPVGKDAWIAEFTAWRAELRPGHNAVPDDFPVEEGEEPPTEDDIYRELADGWFISEFPELAHACSPHRIALLAAHIRDYYTSDYALVVLGLVPDLAAWLTERSGLSATVGGRTRAYADGTAVPDVDLGHRAHSLLTPIRE
ncbi:hypothetical protein QMK19_41025 [Streptomyces sp. H10-C2]|uniref:hypothetical protein n=1 Tax=unclassified Streptomyces TaxID=2593676 RepID=UPI0024BA21F6|nr:MULTISPECIES: hypothetical protein [unclassified Streptomyces]MDJ0347596.1 hypothetical protein [Streptomyces sp. PH10-H1]MDJ0375782.1 hypothetical protein [Streptomyces sp. H10-C2]